MRQGVIVLVDEAADVLERRRALLVRGEEQLKDPAGLPDEAEVGQVARLAFLVGGGQDRHEGRFAVEAHAPPVRGRLLGDVGRPGFRVQLPERLAEAPEQSVVVF